MITEKIQRRYPQHDWDYKAISTIVDLGSGDRNIIYYTLYTKGKSSKGVEVSGKNYLLGSSAPSHSRKYNLINLPTAYKEIVKELIKIHHDTSWSKADYVNEN